MAERQDTSVPEPACEESEWDRAIRAEIQLEMKAAAVSLPVFILMALIPLPFALLAGPVAVAVAFVNLDGVVMAVKFWVRRINRQEAAKLMALSLAPGVVFWICALIAGRQ